MKTFNEGDRVEFYDPDDGNEFSGTVVDGPHSAFDLFAGHTGTGWYDVVIDGGGDAEIHVDDLYRAGPPIKVGSTVRVTVRTSGGGTGRIFGHATGTVVHAGGTRVESWYDVKFDDPDQWDVIARCLAAEGYSGGISIIPPIMVDVMHWDVRLLAPPPQVVQTDFGAVLRPPVSVIEEIVAALEGDSNDAEHDALVSVARALGIEWKSQDE